MASSPTAWLQTEQVSPPCLQLNLLVEPERAVVVTALTLLLPPHSWPALSIAHLGHRESLLLGPAGSRLSPGPSLYTSMSNSCPQTALDPGLKSLLNPSLLTFWPTTQCHPLSLLPTYPATLCPYLPNLHSTFCFLSLFKLTCDFLSTPCAFPSPPLAPALHLPGTPFLNPHKSYCDPSFKTCFTSFMKSNLIFLVNVCSVSLCLISELL